MSKKKDCFDDWADDFMEVSDCIPNWVMWFNLLWLYPIIKFICEF